MIGHFNPSMVGGRTGEGQGGDQLDTPLFPRLHISRRTNIISKYQYNLI